MPTYIGIDGGGSTTRILMQRVDDGAIIDDLTSSTEPPQYFEYPVSLKVRNGDFASSANQLHTLLAGVPVGEGLLIAIGLSGMSRAEDQDALKSAIHSIPELRDATLHIESDATLTLKAAIPEGEEGILLIAGTGSVVYYQTASGHVGRLGGWGPMLSDEGSGYRIGLIVLRVYIADLDALHLLEKRAFPDSLIEAVRNQLPPEIVNDRMAIARMAEREAAFVASFAKTAMDLAIEDHDVYELISPEIFELHTLLAPVVRSNVLSANRPHTLWLAGSIAKHPVTMAIASVLFSPQDIMIELVDDLAPCAKALEIARGLHP